MAKTKKTKETKNVTIKEEFYGNEVNGVLYYTKELDLDFLRGLALMKEVAEGDK